MSSMLDLLVRSKARRRLYHALFVAGHRGDAASLAAAAGVGRASVDRELRTLREAGLVRPRREGGSVVFDVAADHPHARALRALASPPEDEAADGRVRNALFTLGAPTFGEEVPVPSVEEALVDGVALAHRDGTVASVLPVVLFKQRDAVDPDALARLARERKEAREVGFFLDLTTELSGDPRFAAWAESLRDRRRTRVRYLFRRDERSALSREIAERHTPDCARRWNLRGNMTLDGYASMFGKHVRA